ncbi:hypothetical protein GCM10019016_010550 [Streptomyces prasinosporus]|uniref:Lactococcin 972 family bacteriocin n=1 Tax=Streptomyces prasinosporus TaxID=68256 RepID=A0ABP6TFG0_9ACTN
MKSGIAALMTAGAMVLGSVVVAVPASATSEVAFGAEAGCSEWHDANTYGVSCDTTRTYYAYATCVNGTTLYGPRKTRGGWSYVYCSSVASKLSGWGYKYV